VNTLTPRAHAAPQWFRQERVHGPLLAPVRAWLLDDGSLTQRLIDTGRDFSLLRPALLRLIRWDRPIGSLLLLWPTLWALWIAAEGVPDPTSAGHLHRSAPCSCARRAASSTTWRTATLDGGVPHPQPAAGHRRGHGAEAVAFFLCLCLAAFALVLMTNLLTVLLSLPALALASCYPLMKRFTHLPQVVLGLAFSWSIPMAFAAQRGELPPALWLLFTATCCGPWSTTPSTPWSTARTTS
jgi:hypothetical protein